MATKPYAVWKVGKEEYRLKISAGAAIDAERRLGKSLLYAMAEMDRTETRVAVLRAALQKYHHGMDEDAVLALYDSYMDEGGDLDALMDVLMEVYVVSGFMKKEKAAETGGARPIAVLSQA